MPFYMGLKSDCAARARRSPRRLVHRAAAAHLLPSAAARTHTGPCLAHATSPCRSAAGAPTPLVICRRPPLTVAVRRSCCLRSPLLCAAAVVIQWSKHRWGRCPAVPCATRVLARSSFCLVSAVVRWRARSLRSRRELIPPATATPHRAEAAATTRCLPRARLCIPLGPARAHQSHLSFTLCGGGERRRECPCCVRARSLRSRCDPCQAACAGQGLDCGGGGGGGSVVGSDCDETHRQTGTAADLFVC